jgi:hypothetical protein
MLKTKKRVSKKQQKFELVSSSAVENLKHVGNQWVSSALNLTANELFRPLRFCSKSI